MPCWSGRGQNSTAGRPFAPSDISMVYWFAEFPADPAALDYDENQHSRDWQHARDACSRDLIRHGLPSDGRCQSVSLLHVQVVV